jgi:hypothetical protein
MRAEPSALQGPKRLACIMCLRPCLLLQVIAKGKPEDAMPGIKDKQQQFAEGQNSIQAVLNSQGTKVGVSSTVSWVTVGAESGQQALGMNENCNTQQRQQLLVCTGAK